MASSTVENYVKRIYMEQPDAPKQLVPMGRLASAMSVAPGTATSMIKALADSGLVDYSPREGVRLTHQGEQLALHVLRRHRLVELLLVDVLGLDWSQVHEEAEELEHAISDRVLDKIDALLGHPSTDPHGDPIPTARGKVSQTHTRSLIDAALNTPLNIAQVADQDPAFLRFAHQHGLTPGACVTVIERNPTADALTLQREGHPPLTLGANAAEKLLVHVESS